MGGEYEPQDSRNVTGTNTNAPGQSQSGDRWSEQAQQGQTPNAAGQPGATGMNQSGAPIGQAGSGQPQQFEASHQRASGGETGTGQFADQIREHMEVIGADGAHVGTVDHIDGDRIKLTKKDSSAGFAEGSHEGHHHYLPLSQVAGIEGDKVRLAASGATAYGMEAEE